MKQRLVEALSARYPAMKASMATRYVDKYVTAVLTEIATQYVLMNREDICNEISFAADKVSAASGRAKIKSKSTYIYSMMQACASTSLVLETYTGNSITHRVSKVLFNPKYKKEIMDAIRSMAIELNTKHLNDLDAKANHSINIDKEALSSYIEATRTSLINPPSLEYEDKLLRNLLVANQLLVQAKEQDGDYYVDEYWEEIDSGRIQGHGISLQRIAKEVRHAALGRCHRYDFKTASYALMTSLALQLDSTLQIAALKDYIKNRSEIRKRIAADIGISEEWMKEVFTSIGFGAELKDNPYNSIRHKLGQDKYYKLICNSEFLSIKQQLDQVSNTIHKHAAFADKGFELLGRTYTQINPKDDKKRTKNQKLAWIYQCMESHALGMFVESVPADYKIMLMVHDCLYLKKQLPLQQLNDIRWKLAQVYPLLNFEHNVIVPIHADGFISRSERNKKQQVETHEEFIAEQERKASGYEPMHSTVSATPSMQPKRQVMTPWGLVDADLM
jgi:hypothetical protein